MEPITYQELVRQYARGVDSGAYDADLDRRTRRLTVILLNTAANLSSPTRPYEAVGRGDGSYREAIVADFHRGQWDANVGFLLDAVSPSGREAYGAAMERATDILRNI